MSTYFGSLLHRITLSNTPQLLWLGGMILAILTLAILHHLWKKDLKKIRLWRMLCLIPLILAGIHVLIYVRGYTSFASDYFPLYIIGIVALFPIPFARRKFGYGVAAWITGISVVVFSMIFLTMPPNDFNHSRESYTE